MAVKYATSFKKGVKSPMPKTVLPMLCTLTREVIQSDEYVHEIKLDGYRIIGQVGKASLVLSSRSGKDYTAKYPPVADALKKLKHQVVLDGEVTVLNADGKPDFDALQDYGNSGGTLCYYVFDILWLDGYNLMALPLLERKNILFKLLRNNPVIRYSEHFDDGIALFQQMHEIGMEGVVSKKKDSPYVPDQRAENWLKTPTMKRQEFVIGGYAESDKNRSFRSLLFGAYNQKGQLEWIGRSGGGFKQSEMPAILKKLKALEIKKTPFSNEILDTKGAVIHFVKPTLVANFAFATWTKSGRIRKPATFLGFRKDKDPKQVVREVPKEVAGNEEPISPAVQSHPATKTKKNGSR
jgi:bifunctional non-homologous end joining protein LigD